jgi:hypothetical protein
MTLTSADLDPKLLERAKELTGAGSNRAVLDLALRRLIASQQKSEMIREISKLTDLQDGINAPIEHYPLP